MQSTTSSTRTFMTPTPADKETKKPKQPKPPRQRKAPRGYLPWLIVIVLLLASLFLYDQYREAKRKLEAGTTKNSQQVTDTVSRVSKLILLPTNETPTIVTVKDASKLKGEAFYTDAKDGDVTLVYSKQKRAILYRPSQNIIVNVAAVTVEPTN
jgi:hypothetical protein